MNSETEAKAIIDYMVFVSRFVKQSVSEENVDEFHNYIPSTFNIVFFMSIVKFIYILFRD